MNLPTTTFIILHTSKQLKRLGIAIMWLQLIAVAWMVDALYSSTSWSKMTVADYGITFSSMLLALGILFLLYIYTVSLPKSECNALLFKQKRFEKPTILRVLLGAQIIVLLYSAFSAKAWGQFYTINIFELHSLYGIFILIVFLALHITILISIAFLVKLARLDELVNNRFTAAGVKETIQRLRKASTILCAITLILIAWRLIHKLPVILGDIGYLASSAQLLLLIYLSNFILVILLIFSFIRLITGKSVTKKGTICGWLTVFVAIDLYVSLEIAEGGVKVLLEYPEVMIPILLSVIAESLLLINLIRSKTYSIANSRLLFVDNAVKTIQKAFINDKSINCILEKPNDKNEYIRFCIDTCDRHGDVYFYKDKSILGWLSGEFFPPKSAEEMEPKLFNSCKAIPVQAIAENARKFAYIWILGTVPDARGKGLAKILIEKTLNIMSKTNVEECWLNTAYSDNLQYYEKFGFKLFSEQVTELGVTTYIMVNKLANRKLTL